MHIIADIFDPADNGFDISDLSVLLGVIVVLGGIVLGIVRWNAKRVASVRTRERDEMERRIRDAVELVAVKVQPKNGGRGWEDVHSKLDVVVGDVRYLRNRLDTHIDQHHEKG